MSQQSIKYIKFGSNQFILTILETKRKYTSIFIFQITSSTSSFPSKKIHPNFQLSYMPQIFPKISPQTHAFFLLELHQMASNSTHHFKSNEQHFVQPSLFLELALSTVCSCFRIYVRYLSTGQQATAYDGNSNLCLIDSISKASQETLPPIDSRAPIFWHVKSMLLHMEKTKRCSSQDQGDNVTHVIR